jgi:signal transduction histidine kinase/CheY-like chemotaxis protein/HPt (histidine-containing phosphotransfer) domain-containing protein
MRTYLLDDAYAGAMLLCGLIFFLASARAWFGTRKDLSRGIAILSAAAFVWSAFRLLQWELVSEQGQMRALELQYLGIVVLPGSLFMIAAAVEKKTLRKRELGLIFFPALVFLCIIATNGAHHFFWKGEPLSSLPASPEGAWAFWLFVAYTYSLMAASFLIMARAACRAKGLTRFWIRRLLLLLLFPFATNVIFVLIFIRRTGYDPSPIAFAISASLLALGFRHFDILELVPYAKQVILESIDSPLIAVDAAGFIVGANEEARRIAPTIGALESSSIGGIVPGLTDAVADRDTREWVHGGVEYLITCYPVKKESRRWRGRIYLFRDVSAFNVARREAEAARARADAANAAKSAFVAVISHELRNPLNAIIGLTDLNLRAGPPAEIKQDLEVILSSGNILLGLVNDLLDLSKIEAGKMELESLDFDLREKVMSMLRAFRPAVEKKGIFLDIIVEEGAPRFVKGDPLRYGQVLMNLVSNAVKFTDRGAVSVSIAPLAGIDDGDPRSVRVMTSVRDTGMGIAASQLPLLFRDFAQADASVGRRFGGTGLGLSISKRLVALFGGEIEAVSSPGQGSTFSFSSRFEPVEASMVEASTGGVEARRRELRALVVDDDPINSAIARRYLLRLGHEAVLASSGAEALEQVRKCLFDLVLLDLGLPDMNGFEACKRIRAETASGWAGSLPIAAMTARAEAGLRVACATAGMIDCLTKPLDPGALGRLVNRVAEKARELAPHAAASVGAARIPELLEPAEGPQPPEAGGIVADRRDLIDTRALLERIEGDVDFMKELLRIFDSEAEGRDAAIAEASAARDLRALKKLCHALKGSCLSLCAYPLAESCGALEVLGEADAPGKSDLIEGRVVTLRRLLGETAAAARALLGPQWPDNGLPERP